MDQYKIKVPVGQKPDFIETDGPFRGVQSFKPNEAMQQELVDAMKARFPGLYLDANGTMRLPGERY